MQGEVSERHVAVSERMVCGRAAKERAKREGIGSLDRHERVGGDRHKTSAELAVKEVRDQSQRSHPVLCFMCTGHEP